MAQQQQWSDQEIERYAKTLAPRIRKEARKATNEIELRLSLNPLLRDFAQEAGLDLAESHDHLVGKGRPDSVYGRVVIEYEPPRSLTDRNTAATNKHAIGQVKDYINALCRQDAQEKDRLLGVVLDGDRIIFARYRREEWEVGPCCEVDATSVADLLVRLRALRGKALLPEVLVKDFGGVEARGKFEASEIARRNVSALYKTLSASTSPKVDALFAQWRLLFSEVCGYEFGSPKLDLTALAASYGIMLKRPRRSAKAGETKRRNPQAEMLFFCIHTYYATLITLLAAEIVTFYASTMMPSYLGQLESLSGNDLRDKLRDLHETGGIFGQALVQNFLEGDFFSWYLEDWNDDLAEAQQAVVRALRAYDPATFRVEPDETRDLLKKLYQYLLPKKLRHDLGEYYTPDWLAELVLNEVEYTGDLTKRVLDPSCGSGTFLTLEIRRAKEWARDKHWGDRETLDGILGSIVGFDLNPLAVITARTNYLIALGDLLRHRHGPVEIPVYLCDAVQTPTEARQVDLLSGRGYPLETAVGTLRVPAGLATQRQIAALARLLEDCVRGRYETTEFLTRGKRELGLSPGDFGAAEETLSNLYAKLRKLDEENRNGIWARIIKNFFAPVFAVAERPFDYLAGNLPWINWESLPDTYRESTRGLWEDYGLFTLKGWRARMGGSKKDLSALFLYVAAHRYLAENGKLAFLVTESLFKTSGAGEGFRRLELPAHPGRSRTPLGVLTVHDLVGVQPFEGASNRTAGVVGVKGTQTRYPVRYVVWRRKRASRVREDSSLDSVMAATTRARDAAQPVSDRRGAPWITGPPAVLKAVVRLIGPSDYKAVAGACTWLNGVYWVDILQDLGDGTVLIQNMHEEGKTVLRSVQARIERDLLYPLLRGHDIKPWCARSEGYILMVQDPRARKGIAESEMRTRLPLTYAYLKQFETELRQRSGFRKYFEASDPFYSIYDVGPRTVMQVKVVWRQMIPDMTPAVICLSDGLPVIPQHVVTLVGLSDSHEAHFICAALRAAPSRFIATRYSTGKSFGAPHVLDHVAVPRFQPTNPLHLRLSELSQAAHEAAAAGEQARVAEIEQQVDEAAAELWGLFAQELEVIQQALREK